MSAAARGSKAEIARCLSRFRTSENQQAGYSLF
jgi:hypothetical protein